MPVTIKDIARKAGVSHATVSRALNGHPAIPERTAAAIRGLAREMGYLPSAAARGLKTNRSRAIGVIVSRIDDPYFGEILQGAEEALQGAGYSLFVASSHEDLLREARIVRAMGEHRVDGVIICSVSFDGEHARQFRQFGMPLVVINNQSDEEYRFSIANDDLDGGRQVARHLLQLGHRRLAYLGNGRAGRTNADRLRGVQLEMETWGVDASRLAVIEQHNGDVEDGAAGAHTLLSLPTRPGAVFCFNDLMALGALGELRNAGLRIPGEISVAGFDNIQFSAVSNPPLTTFDQPKHAIGSQAAQMMLELLAAPGGSQGGAGPVSRLLRGRLLVRQSTAEPQSQE